MLQGAKRHQSPGNREDRPLKPTIKEHNGDRRVGACDQDEDHGVVKSLHAFFPHLPPGDRVIERTRRIERDHCKTKDDRSDTDAPVGSHPREKHRAEERCNSCTAVQEPPNGVLHLPKRPTCCFHRRQSVSPNLAICTNFVRLPADSPISHRSWIVTALGSVVPKWTRRIGARTEEPQEACISDL